MFEVFMLLYISLEFEIRNEHFISLVMTLTYSLLCTFKVNFNVESFHIHRLSKHN